MSAGAGPSAVCLLLDLQHLDHRSFAAGDGTRGFQGRKLLPRPSGRPDMPHTAFLSSALTTFCRLDELCFEAGG